MFGLAAHFLRLLLVLQVSDDNPGSNNSEIRNRLAGDNPDLSTDERSLIRQFLESFPDED